MGTYAIAGGKGGVGKTTTVATLGVLLSEAGYDVALVDTDLAMANLADVLGVGSEAGVHRVLAGEAIVHDAIVEVADGLDLVPGGRAIDHFDAADPANLRRVVSPLDAEYDVVLVDTGAGLNHETLVAAGLADGTVLVTTPADEAVVDVAKTAEFVAHADATVLGAVLARADERTDPGSIAAELGVPILGVVPADPSLGTEPATDGPVGEAYLSVAATLATCHEDDPGAVDAPAGVGLTPDALSASDGSATAASGGLSASDD